MNDGRWELDRPEQRWDLADHLVQLYEEDRMLALLEGVPLLAYGMAAFRIGLFWSLSGRQMAPRLRMAQEHGLVSYDEEGYWYLTNKCLKLAREPRPS